MVESMSVLVVPLNGSNYPKECSTPNGITERKTLENH